MVEETQKSASKGSNNSLRKGIAVVGLCVIGCKLPLLLAFFGFGGLGATASVLDLPPIVQTLSVTVGILGFALMTGYLLYRVYRRTHR